MALNNQFFAPLQIRLGLAVPPLAEQVSEQGFVLRDSELWEDRHRAWNLLRIGGFYTAAEEQRIAYRLIKGISLAAGYEHAIADLKSQITQLSEADAPTEEEQPAADNPAPIDALDDYLTRNKA